MAMLWNQAGAHTNSANDMIVKLKQSSNHTHTHNVMYLPVDDTISDDNTGCPWWGTDSRGAAIAAMEHARYAANWNECNWRAEPIDTRLAAWATTVHVSAQHRRYCFPLMHRLQNFSWWTKEIHYANYLVHNSIIKRFSDNQPSIDNFTMRFVWLWNMQDANIVRSMNGACLKLVMLIFDWKDLINTLAVLQRSLVLRIPKVYLTSSRLVAIPFSREELWLKKPYHSRF